MPVCVAVFGIPLQFILYITLGHERRLHAPLVRLDGRGLVCNQTCKELKPRSSRRHIAMQ